MEMLSKKIDGLSDEFAEIKREIKDDTLDIDGFVKMTEELEKYKENLKDNFYGKWIESYSSEDYALCAKKNIDFANKICAGVDENKKEKLKEIFIKASIYEMKFWDMAYKEEI